MEGITFSDGSPFSIENVLPKPDGYQIVHKKSGKYLPQTIGRELYSKAAAIKKMNVVATMYRNDSSFDIFNYKLVSIYKWELKYAHLKFIYDADDKLFD